MGRFRSSKRLPAGTLWKRGTWYLAQGGEAKGNQTELVKDD